MKYNYIYVLQMVPHYYIYLLYSVTAGIFVRGVQTLLLFLFLTREQNLELHPVSLKANFWSQQAKHGHDRRCYARRWYSLALTQDQKPT